MGRFIVVPGITPTGVKVDVIDPILPTAGALVLLDPMHPSQQWASGVPTSGTALTNIAQTQAQAALPSLASTDIKPVLTIGSTFAAHGLAERTTKGGLHLARSAVAGDANTYAKLAMPDNFIQSSNGLKGVYTHNFFVSLWGRVTKATDSSLGTAAVEHSAFAFGANSGYGFYTRRSTGETNFPTDSRRLNWRASGTTNTGTTLGPFIQNIAINGFAGAITSETAILLGQGNTPGLVTSGVYGLTPSFVFYRFYLEDLTVSGRSYATVDALDSQMFTKDVLTAGGRYYGDTFTDPTTLVA